jgi:hypothetical protein
MYVRTTKAVKRLTLELKMEQYEFVRKQAMLEGTNVASVIRRLIDDFRSKSSKQNRKKYKSDSFYGRRGSFNGPSDLAEHHDRYLYGENAE